MEFFDLEQVRTTPEHVLSNYCPVPDDSKYVKTSPVLLGPWRTDTEMYDLDGVF